MIKIYGKQNCPNCVAVKKLASAKGVNYDYLELGKDYTLDELRELAPDAKAAPVVFEADTGGLIGGFNEAKKFLDSMV